MWKNRQKKFDFEYLFLKNAAEKAILRSIISASKSNQKNWEERAFVLSQTYRNLTK